jgi:hypothetical protein
MIKEIVICSLFISSGWAQPPKEFKLLRADTLTDGTVVYYKQQVISKAAEWDVSPGFCDIRFSSSRKIQRLIDTIDIIGGYFPLFLIQNRKLVLFESGGKIFLLDPVRKGTKLVAQGVFPHVLSHHREGFFYFVFDSTQSKHNKFMEGENIFNVFYKKYYRQAVKLGNIKVWTSGEDMGGLNPLAWVDIRLLDSNRVSFSARGIIEQVYTLQ